MYTHCAEAVSVEYMSSAQGSVPCKELIRACRKSNNNTCILLEVLPLSSIELINSRRFRLEIVWRRVWVVALPRHIHKRRATKSNKAEEQAKSGQHKGG